jgi:hypothetical protein
MYDNPGNHPTDPTWQTALARLCATGARIALFAETAVFAGAMAAAAGREAMVLPHPSSLSFAPPPPADQPFVLFLAGQARADKGTALAHAVAAELGRRTARPTVIRVQHEQSGRTDYGPVRMEPLAGHLDDAAYASAWRSAHAGLFLHDARVYRLRGSAVVCDALAMGRPFVALAGSSLVPWAMGGNAVISEPDPPSVAAAIIDLQARHAALLARVPEAEAGYRRALRDGVAAVANLAT